MKLSRGDIDGFILMGVMLAFFLLMAWIALGVLGT